MTSRTIVAVLEDALRDKRHEQHKWQTEISKASSDLANAQGHDDKLERESRELAHMIAQLEQHDTPQFQEAVA